MLSLCTYGGSWGLPLRRWGPAAAGRTPLPWMALEPWFTGLGVFVYKHTQQSWKRCRDCARPVGGVALAVDVNESRAAVSACVVGVV